MVSSWFLQLLSGFESDETVFRLSYEKKRTGKTLSFFEKELSVDKIGGSDERKTFSSALLTKIVSTPATAFDFALAVGPRLRPPVPVDTLLVGRPPLSHLPDVAILPAANTRQPYDLRL